VSESSVTFGTGRAIAVDPHDDIGRRMLSQLGVRGLLELWANLGIPLAVIPGEYWVQDVAADKTSVAVVSCPCGMTPTVPAGGIEMCRKEDEWATCARAYVFTGRNVLVANSPPRRAA
jgi:hypothetical protein